MNRSDTGHHDGAPSLALVETELGRIDASLLFRRSPRHRALLRHLVTRALAGQSDSLKESVLAAEVFGRDPARFDPRRDTIVRVEARRLRAKLIRYYEEEGASSALIFRLEPGRYAPIVEVRVDGVDDGVALPSLAVLPLLNLSGAPEHESWCDTLTEELIDALVQIPGLKVVARTSSFRYKGRHDDVRATARALGVRTVLEGSVQRDGARCRVVAQLINADDGIHLWSNAFDTPADDTLPAVHRLARAIVRALRLQPGSATRLRRVTRRVSANAEAQDCFQRGKYLLGGHTPDAYRQAVTLFERAAAADPQFALAWGGIAQAQIGLYGMTAVPDAAGLAAARAAIDRALALDPELGDVHAAAAFLAFAHDRDWVRAERAALDAIRSAPSRAYVHHNYAWMLTFAGRFDEALQTYAIARELDPLDLMLRVHAALVPFYRREHAVAADAFARVAEVEPRNLVARVLLALSRLGSGQDAAALADCETIAREQPQDSIGPIGVVQVHAAAGRPAAARAAFDELLGRIPAERVGPYRMATAHAWLGEPDAAFDWLERAADARDMNLVCLAVDPGFDPLRDDPRWRPALARYGLPDVDARAGL